MKAIIISRQGKAAYKEVKDPEVSTGEVKIRVMAAGLCGSDIHKLLRDWKSQRAVNAEIWGHEISGVVEKIGPGVETIKCGDAVVVNPIITTSPGMITNMRSIGKELNGGFAECVVVPAGNIKRIKSEFGFEEATLTDGIASSLHGYHISMAKKGFKMAILGDGSIALSTAIICTSYHQDVTLVGKHEKNLELASNLGITAVNINKAEKLPSGSFDFVFETVGRNQEGTMNTAIKLVKEKGTIIGLGVFDRDYLAGISLRNLLYKEAKLTGSNSYGKFGKKDEFDMALRLLHRRKVDFSKLITHILPLKEFQRGLELVRDRKESGAIKVVFRPNT